MPDDFRNVVRVLEAKLADVEFLDLLPDQLDGVIGAMGRRHDHVPENNLLDEHLAGFLLLLATAGGGSVRFGGGRRAGVASPARRHLRGESCFIRGKGRGRGRE